MTSTPPAWWDGPVQVAPRIWWVGAVRPDERFQCHAYLIEAGTQSVLIDPGSSDAIDDVLAKVRRVVPIDSIRWVVCHHSDPDIAAGLPLLRSRLTRADVQLVTEWRAQTLLHHYHAGFPYYLVEDNDWQLPLDDGRCLRFVLTPYLHFPGALCSWEESSGTLFSSDLFGGFTDGHTLFASDMSYFEAIRPFHEHYMPGRDILAAGLDRIRRAFHPITMIAPQHGCVVPGEFVDEMFTRLSDLECGIFLLARDDLDIARLLQVATTVRRMTDALVMAHDLPELARVAQRVLPDLLPVASIDVFAVTDDEGTLRFSPDDGFVGTPDQMPHSSSTSLVLPVLGDGPQAAVHLSLTAPATITHEMESMFVRLAPALRVALNRHLQQRRLQRERAAWQETASHDSLTGLYNRAALNRLAESSAVYGVLMIDIDHFKQVNDRFGHQAGDLVLRRVADACRESLRATDRLFRYGGEEMLALVDSADAHEIATAAERLRTTVEGLSFDDVPGLDRVTVSVGVALHHRGQPTAAAIAAADTLLYAAKHDGRNRIAVEMP